MLFWKGSDAGVTIDGLHVLIIKPVNIIGVLTKPATVTHAA